MIVQCPDCSTRFRLADEKVKPGGIKVRCSRCKHIFKAMPPEPEPEPEPEAPTPPAAEDEIDFGAFNMEPVPGEEQAVETAAAGAESPSAPEPESEEPGRTAGEGPSGPEEEEIDFGEIDFGEPAETDEGPDERDSGGPAEFAPDEAGETGKDDDGEFDFGAISFDETTGDADEQRPGGSTEFVPGEAGEVPEGGAPEDKTEEFDFGEISFEAGGDEEGFSKSDEIDLSEEPVAGTSDNSDFRQEDDGEFLFEEQEPPSSELGDFDFDDDQAGAEPSAEEFSFDEKSGDLDAFGFEDEENSAGEVPTEDFSFEEELPPSSEGEAAGFGVDESATGDTAGGEDYDSISLDQGEAAETETFPGPGEPQDDYETPPEPAAARPAPHSAPPPQPAGTTKGKGPFSRLLRLVLVLLLVLVGAGAGFLYWQEGSLDPQRVYQLTIGRFTKNSSTVPEAPQIELTDLSGKFVTNRQAGQLFVIHGRAINRYEEERSAIAVRGILYDSAGKRLKQQPAFGGNPLATETLRTAPWPKIEDRMKNQFGDSLSNLNVPPDKSVRFTIVFRDLPKDLAEFTVEAASSQPGSK